uniref:Uncharacterized protein n=1 Tax=Lepeophtheirus salmonis TaxID=72036 RepID=A0A0K2V6U5_LEPSM
MRLLFFPRVFILNSVFSIYLIQLCSS